MQAITPGHLYELANHEKKDEQGQLLQFIHKEPATEENAPELYEENKQPAPGTLITVQDGTTNEEVLEMLIDRLRFLNQKLPSPETQSAILDLKRAKSSLEKRTASRINRNVEGTNNL